MKSRGDGMSQRSKKMNEIKVAFNTMKKELKKEFPNETNLHYGFTMSERQIKNNTATLLVTSTNSYADRINFYLKQIETVLGYESWTNEEKKRSIERDAEQIKIAQSKEKRFGTPYTEATTTAKMLYESESFKRFAKAIGRECVLAVEENDGAYMVRFFY